MEEKAHDQDPSQTGAEPKNRGRRDSKDKTARSEDPSQTGAERGNHKPLDRISEIIQHEDLGEVEFPRASYGSPYRKTGETFGLTIKVPRSVILFACAAGIAIIAHLLLNMSGITALIMGTLTVVSIMTADNHPEYVTLIFKQMSQLARKLKIK
jgi:hypothetical protein